MSFYSTNDMLDTEGRSVGPKSGELSVIHEEPSGALLTSSQLTGIEHPESKPSLMPHSFDSKARDFPKND